ncbi:HAMP domain-containing protein [Cognaticolwellia aestuarii]|uniref:HAMP domain-containing protein n=1 Tax=Cognaticolwellia aestuarii TaxID=329993 RepID=UPI002467AD74|nr:HAMP domain-containing protein [Cognaticolwellia aestuarii]
MTRLQDAMKNIAEDYGDLTQRIAPLKNAEIGKLVDEFNIFVESIQELVKQIVVTTHQKLDTKLLRINP